MPLARLSAALFAGVVMFSSCVLVGQAAPQTSYSGPPGKVRVIAQKVRSDGNRVEWKWIIVSDRSWNSHTTDSHGNLTLEHMAPVPPSPPPSKKPAPPTSGAPSAPGLPDGLYEHAISLNQGRHGDDAAIEFNSITRHAGQVIATGGGAHPMETKSLPPANKVLTVLMTGDKVYSLPCRIPLMQKQFYHPTTGKPKGKPMTVYLEIKP